MEKTRRSGQSTISENADISLENELGCGLMGAFFPRKSSKLNTSTVPPIPTKISDTNSVKNSRNWRSSSCGKACLDSRKSTKPSPKLGDKPFRKTSLNSSRNSSSCEQNNIRKSSSDGTRNSNKASSNFSSVTRMSQVVNLAYTQKLRREPSFTSTDLSMTIFSHRKSRTNGTLNRDSTGNVSLLDHLGNLKLQGNQNPSSDIKKKGSVLMGNIVRQPSVRSHQSGNTFRHSANKLDPDALKSIGNEQYRQGKFEEALALYNQAIEIDPKNACYYSNKSASLMCLGRLIEAVLACREAIRLDPSYHNAHFRLARLYLRLGDAEKAIDHYKQSGRKVDKKDIAEAHDLKRQIIKCTEAQKLRDFNTLLKETHNSISLGADSAPQIFAMRAEALLKLHRHEEAYTTIQNGPDFQTKLYTSLFGTAKTAYLLIVRAEAYATVGKFEDAIVAAQEAVKLDQSNEVTNTTLRRIKRLVSARLKGNELFKGNEFSEACTVYTEGLEQEPYNSILLFNRAACRFKLGQFERAVEDCTAALVLRPSYAKARVRRADCNIKLERWKAAIQDCEVLMQENPEDEVSRVFLEANVQLQKQLVEDHNQRNLFNGSNSALVSGN
ncbi:inactive TPR repeat-containing thioredoxin TTL3-like [Nicotiana tomentosiformis]|uniref:inactive TPR repeat-containing thioredoxin TTL3-like n=1 Tax=Nicotiana tomentosiformis TaxID=4098 RepID=UPI00051BC0CF|nr:inactive TPR repeat-containing thioredoxin TTL3-like [Nicotiana tomentosiformis]